MVEFIGNEAVVKGLHSVFSASEPGHGYLFAGPEGVGKATLARQCAKIALCHSPRPEGACGDCVSCKLSAQALHPDILEVRAAQNDTTISIEEIRMLRQFLGLTPFAGRHKIALVEEADTMTTEAANALLKVLEEPAPQSILILTSAYPLAVLPTVRSRLITVRLHAVEQHSVVSWLKTALPKTAQETLIRAAEYAGGSPGYAFRLASDPALLQEEQKRWEDFSRMASGTRFEKAVLFSGLRSREELVPYRRSWLKAAHSRLRTQCFDVSCRNVISVLLRHESGLPVDATLTMENALY